LKDIIFHSGKFPGGVAHDPIPDFCALHNVRVLNKGTTPLKIVQNPRNMFIVSEGPVEGGIGYLDGFHGGAELAHDCQTYALVGGSIAEKA
jgi:hypothetical protein